MLLLSQLINSDNILEGSSKLYFTESRAIGSILTGFSPTNSAILNTDSIVSAFSKAQGQINTILNLDSFTNLGNAFGINAILGTTDNYSLSFISNNSTYLMLDAVNDVLVITKNITTDTNDTYSIGDSNYKFKNLFLSDHIEIGGLCTNFIFLTSNYTLLSSNNYVECDDTSGSFTIQLVDATLYPGIVFEIKKTRGDVNNYIQLSPILSQIIYTDGYNTGGTLSYNITDIGSSLRIKSDGFNWFLIRPTSPINAINGLTLNSNNIKLGGDLTNDTYIDGSQALLIGSVSPLSLFTVNSFDTIRLSSIPDIDTNNYLEVNTTGFIINYTYTTSNVSIYNNVNDLVLKSSGYLSIMTTDNTNPAIIRTDNLTASNTYFLPQKTGAQTFAMLSDLSGGVSDTVYGISWSGVTGIAPSKNALYNKIETLVTGPASATDNAIALFDNTTGKIIKNSLVTIDSSGNMSGLNNVTLSGAMNIANFKTITSATVNTTNSTPVVMYSIPVPTDTTMLVEIRIIGRRTGGSAGTVGDSATYMRYVKVKNVAGTLTMGTINSVYTYEDQVIWDATLIISGTDLNIQIIGATNNNITWNGVITTTSN